MMNGMLHYSGIEAFVGQLMFKKIGYNEFRLPTRATILFERLPGAIFPRWSNSLFFVETYFLLLGGRIVTRKRDSCVRYICDNNMKAVINK